MLTLVLFKISTLSFINIFFLFRANTCTPLTSEELVSLLNEEKIDEHLFLSEPKEMTIHERFLIHLPIPIEFEPQRGNQRCNENIERQRDACNQRAIILYGITEDRDLAQEELKKIASQICRIWQKKLNVEFFHNSKEVCFKRRITPELLVETLSKFK